MGLQGTQQLNQRGFVDPSGMQPLRLLCTMLPENPGTPSGGTPLSDYGDPLCISFQVVEQKILISAISIHITLSFPYNSIWLLPSG